MSIEQARRTRPPRRKSATRAEFVRAAAEVFAEHGTTNVGIDAICDRAGYTRGAFYSNFRTVDELFFALYTQRADEMQERIEHAWAEQERGTAPASDAGALTHTVLAALPADRDWFAIRAAFAVQAQHRPEIQTALRDHAERFRARLQDLLLAVLTAAGREPTIPADSFTRSVIAAHVGAVLQAPLHDDDAELVREATVRGVITGLTRPVESSGVSAPGLA